MKKIKKVAIKLWQDESGQGTAEYVLILVAIVGLGIAFKGKIIPIVEEKMGDIKGKIMSFNPN